MINVTENPDGSLLIDWDSNSLEGQILNTWDESDFINAIKAELIERSEYVNYRRVPNQAIDPVNYRNAFNETTNPVNYRAHGL